MPSTERPAHRDNVRMVCPPKEPFAGYCVTPQKWKGADTDGGVINAKL
jgi:hypothetical protein